MVDKNEIKKKIEEMLEEAKVNLQTPYMDKDWYDYMDSKVDTLEDVLDLFKLEE